MNSASAEMLQVGALSVRFLVEAADSNGSASVFECFVPAGGNMPAPAPSLLCSKRVLLNHQRVARTDVSTPAIRRVRHVDLTGRRIPACCR
jgi:hypothetical protein